MACWWAALRRCRRTPAATFVGRAASLRRHQAQATRILGGRRAALGSAWRARAAALLAEATDPSRGPARSARVLCGGRTAERLVSAAADIVVDTSAALADADAAHAGAVAAATWGAALLSAPLASPPVVPPGCLGLVRRQRQFGRGQQSGGQTEKEGPPRVVGDGALQRTGETVGVQSGNSRCVSGEPSHYCRRCPG